MFYTNPPLCINEQQLREGFAIIDRALETMDKAVGSLTNCASLDVPGARPERSRTRASRIFGRTRTSAPT